jgi:hypothetical protein
LIDLWICSGSSGAWEFSHIGLIDREELGRRDEEMMEWGFEVDKNVLLINKYLQKLLLV